MDCGRMCDQGTRENREKRMEPGAVYVLAAQVVGKGILVIKQ